MNIRRSLAHALALILLTGLVTPSSAQLKKAIAAPGRPGESAAARDQRMAWWREARLGMFIHWGVYAVPAGRYEGKPVQGLGEWIMLRGKIPVATYRDYARQFNPGHYDPEAWVKLAAEAGVKYIVITTKHHDGFALFDSAVTDWDVVDATPYGRDLIAPLVAACRKHGMKIGFYYSQAQDWTHPGGATWNGKTWDPAQKGDMDAYLRTIAVPQVKELLTRYGEVAELWWDTPKSMTPERAALFSFVQAMQPNIIENNRLQDGNKAGDISTPEQHIPDTGLASDWESCMTMNDTWGFRSDDHNWKSAQTLVRNLVDIASKGGNYLLNVGPTADGDLPAPSVERLKTMGAWMKVNGEAIHGTTASPFPKPAWGRFTQKGDRLYAHVFDWPADGKLAVPTGGRTITRASLLAAPGQALAMAPWADGAVLLTLPAQAPDALASVICLERK